MSSLGIASLRHDFFLPLVFSKNLLVRGYGERRPARIKYWLVRQEEMNVERQYPGHGGVSLHVSSERQEFYYDDQS